MERADRQLLIQQHLVDLLGLLSLTTGEGAHRRILLKESLCIDGMRTLKGLLTYGFIG